jgi:electron transfer flavoprotein alpha subunit
VVEAGGQTWLLGSATEAAIGELAGLASMARTVEMGQFQPRRWADLLAPHLPADRHLLLPHCPDGRDLAPHLAAVLDRPLLSAVTELDPTRAVVARHGGATMEAIAIDRPVVATLQIGARTPPQPDDSVAMTIETWQPPDQGQGLPDNGEAAGVSLIEELPADPATIDLAEATRIIGVGAGVGSAELLAEVEAIAKTVEASVGATRVVTDWGWIDVDRQIGTTGVAVDPDLYLAVGISGAIQHTAGLGRPDHIIVVNTDGSCPMMDLADLGLVCDGPRFLTELRAQLDEISRRYEQP